MAFPGTVIAAVGLGEIFLGLSHCISTVVEYPQVLPVFFLRQPVTTVFVNLMVAVILDLFIHAIFWHNTPRFPSRIIETFTDSAAIADVLSHWLIST